MAERDKGVNMAVASLGSTLLPFVACIGVAIALHVTGIGCPIKFVTGVSCPGCGMTRAWLSALGGRLDLALAYHPLFWVLPLVFLLAALRDRMPRRGFVVASICIAAALLVVWALRLALHDEPNVLFSGLLSEDVVSIDVPRWLSLVHSLVTSTRDSIGGGHVLPPLWHSSS